MSNYVHSIDSLGEIIMGSRTHTHIIHPKPTHQRGQGFYIKIKRNKEKIKMHRSLLSNSSLRLSNHSSLQLKRQEACFYGGCCLSINKPHLAVYQGGGIIGLWEVWQQICLSATHISVLCKLWKPAWSSRNGGIPCSKTSSLKHYMC